MFINRWLIDPNGSVYQGTLNRKTLSSLPRLIAEEVLVVLRDIIRVFEIFRWDLFWSLFSFVLFWSLWRLTVVSCRRWSWWDATVSKNEAWHAVSQLRAG